MYELTLKISSQSVHNFLSCFAHKRTTNLITLSSDSVGDNKYLQKEHQRTMVLLVACGAGGVA